MRSAPEVTTAEVIDFYRDVGLLELLFGEQVHVGGLDTTLELAHAAGIGAGQVGVDLCCYAGAGMRVLVRLCDVDSIVGVDLSPTAIELAQQRNERDGLGERISVIEADATATGLPEGSVDFVWSEDAWVYIPNKEAVVAEAARLVRPGGAVAFCDWVEGPAGLTEEDAGRLMTTSHFPSLATLDDYVGFLQRHGLDVEHAEHNNMAPALDHIATAINSQLKYDALRLLSFDFERYELVAESYSWLASLAHAGFLAQGVIIARSPGNRD